LWLAGPWQARSIKYQITTAKLPLARDLDDFVFDDIPINQALIRDLAGGEFLAHQRNVVLVGGTGTGKTHLAIAIARACIRDGARGRFGRSIERRRSARSDRCSCRSTTIFACRPGLGRSGDIATLASTGCNPMKVSDQGRGVHRRVRRRR
jgi:hypothetical protein